MKFPTLHQALDATTRNAEKAGLSITIPMIFGGINYEENRKFTFDTVNPKRPNSKKMWQVSITRIDGDYELVDYYL